MAWKGASAETQTWQEGRRLLEPPVIHQLAPAAMSKKDSVDEKSDKNPTPILESAIDSNQGDASKDETDVPKNALPPVGFFTLWRFATKLELLLNFIGFLAALGAGAAQPLMTLMFGNLTREFVNFGRALQYAIEEQTPEAWAASEIATRDFKSEAGKNALYLTLLGVGIAVTTYTFMATWTYTGEINARRVRERYLQALLRQDIAFFDTVGAGEVATRIQTDTHLVQEGISEKVALAASYTSAFLTGFIIAFAIQWKLALAMSSILPGIMIAGTLITTVPAKRKVKQLDHIADGGNLAEEVISTVRISQAFGGQGGLAKLYEAHVNLAHRVERSIGGIEGGLLGLMFFVGYAAYGLAFHFGTTLILAGESDIGELITVFTSIVIGTFSLPMAVPAVQAMAASTGAASKLFYTIDRVPSIDNASSSGQRPTDVQGEIQLENIQFTYPARPDVPVLRGISLSFKAGKTAALVGASGSGKSTVVSLIERFYDPSSGVVKLDGVDIRDLNLRWLRSQIGLVSQEPTLFGTTIRRNVEHGMIGTPLENATDEERFKAVKEACIKANADGFISKLPNAYDTLVGERGLLLSGGQKQRIAIARAIVSDPRVLLLDEATSALDTESENIVQSALDNAAAGRTTIVIAHRLSTIKDADQIYVVGDGQVLENGTHTELLADPNGPYARLVQAQKLREGEHFDSGTAASFTHDDVQEQAEKEEREIERAAERGLKRAGTDHSVASEVLAKKQKETGATMDPSENWGMFYLFKRLGYINRSAWRVYLAGFIAAACSGMVYPAVGIIYGPAIAGFQVFDPADVRRNGDRTALWFFIISILAALSYAIQNMMFARTAADLSQKLRTLTFRSILRHDIAFFDKEKNSTGSLTSVLAEGPQKISGLAGTTLGTICQSLFTLIGGSIVALVYGWKLALVAIACIPLVMIGGVIELKIVMMKDQFNKAAHEESAQMACEAAGAIRTVSALTREQDCIDIYKKSLEESLRRSTRANVVGTFWFAMSQATASWVIALVFWYGVQLVANLEYTTSQFFVILMSATFASIETGRMFAWVPDISKSKLASKEIFKILDDVPEIDSEATDGGVLSTVQGRITLTDVHFRYPARPGVQVLRGFNLTVEPGTHVALVGASGCGKSTFFQLIERFYDPLSGTVAIDGKPITELNVQEYRKHLALVSQEPTLYAGTVRFNVLLGAVKPQEEVTQEDIERACAEANILDFIKSLPMGFDTPVGGKGNQLSGGQKQRIAIARALLRKPSVLLLDEATSALDSNSERVVQDALDSAARGRTTISVAHRLSTIQQCDLIHFVFEGKVVESGTHDELLQRKGRYAEYVLLQNLSGRT